MGKEAFKALGLEEPLDKQKVLRYMRKFRVVPYWTQDRGLIFRPHVGKSVARRFQEVLHLNGKEDVERVRFELRQASAPTQQGISAEDTRANLREDEIETEIEKRTKARKRTRGPYRKASPFL
jgi:hypothetical protein